MMRSIPYHEDYRNLGVFVYYGESGLRNLEINFGTTELVDGQGLGRPRASLQHCWGASTL